MRWRRKQKYKIAGYVAGALFAVCLGRFYFLYRSSVQIKEEIALNAYISDRLQGQILKTYLPSLSYAVESGYEEADFMERVLVDNIPLMRYIKTQAAYETEIEDTETYYRILEDEADDENGNTALWDALLNENEAAAEKAPAQAESQSEDTIPAEASEVSLEDLKDYSTLVKEFYAIDKSTYIGADQLNVEKLMGTDVSLSFEDGKERGSILVYHTHSQEEYINSVEGDLSTTVVGVGERLSELLRGYGYTVIHDTGVYDLKRDYAYARAGEALEQILAAHPEIEVIIDVHRDGINDDQKLVTEIEGRQMAQFMFFNGLSRSTTLGDITDLPNEYINENLALTFQLQLKAREYYPNLTRRIYLKNMRYNLHYRPKSLLVEVGAQTNTLEEALASMEPLARILDMVLTPTEDE
ncbi:MAG: stage II sporulation protein P [Lachnospiraceae bacterium]